MHDQYLLLHRKQRYEHRLSATNALAAKADAQIF